MTMATRVAFIFLAVGIVKHEGDWSSRDKTLLYRESRVPSLWNRMQEFNRFLLDRHSHLSMVDISARSLYSKRLTIEEKNLVRI